MQTYYAHTLFHAASRKGPALQQCLRCRSRCRMPRMPRFWGNDHIVDNDQMQNFTWHQLNLGYMFICSVLGVVWHLVVVGVKWYEHAKTTLAVEASNISAGSTVVLFACVCILVWCFLDYFLNCTYFMLLLGFWFMRSAFSQCHFHFCQRSPQWFLKPKRSSSTL